MFLNDGKSLFGNWGITISLIILVIVLLLSYNKDLTFPPPQNPRINISGSSITLNFTINPAVGIPIPMQFMVVLVQYDSMMAPTGNNKFYISNEGIINTEILMARNADMDNVQNNNLCQLVNGMPVCQYVFNNLDTVDISGNPYYYKIGISAVYKTGNSRFVLPYNVINNNGIFSLTSALNAQNTQFTDYVKYKQMQTQIKNNNYSNTISTPDGKYELIKSQLGGYPSNLIMEPKSANQNLLNDIIDKSMANAILNVNVNTSNEKNNEKIMKK